MIIFGIHAVEEAISARGRSFDYVAIVPGRGDARVQKIVQLCRAAGIAVRTMPRDQLTRLAQAANHQGVVAVTAEKQYGDVEDVLATSLMSTVRRLKFCCLMAKLKIRTILAQSLRHWPAAVKVLALTVSSFLSWRSAATYRMAVKPSAGAGE